MVSIPPTLLKRLCETLLTCGPFVSDSALRALFIDRRISMFRESLPISSSPTERVNRVISLFIDQFDRYGNNALILFLRVLRERIDPNNRCYVELIDLARELEIEVGTSPERLVTTASQERATTLDLSNRGLTELPVNILEFTHLEYLNLSRNDLSTLPPEISQLHNLQHLDLSLNQLTALPHEIRQLPLETLDVRGNPLPLPEELLIPPSREYPELSTTTLSELRRTLGRVDVFRSGLDYQALFLDSRIAPWHYSVPEASNISDRIETVVDFLFPQSNSSGENALVLFLQVLRDGTSPADVLYRELSELAHQVQRELSSGISSQLVPPSVIFNYLFPATQRALNEVKLLLVGEGGVGKTSLVKRLMRQDYDPHEPMTEGILVEYWYTMLDGEPLRLNIWDFGGQEIMHATHQFFLTRRSLYLVVIDARTGDRGLDYWLQIVRSYGGDSPIIVVINKADILHRELNRVALKAKYPNICAFIHTSCAQEEDVHPGIVQLRQAILDQVAQMPHIRTVWPGNWFEVKTRLEQMDRDHITYDEYAAICAEASIDDTANHSLITFLHELGIALNYHDDPRLQETNVLKPEWVTQAVYAIINARQIVENTGILKFGQLSDILKNRRSYPTHKHGFILNLMCKFKLGFALDDQHKRYLIPDLLPENEILLEGWPPPEDNLFFQYRYSVLPGSIIIRLIVQMHEYIYHGIVWRTGICLHYQNNFALIKSDEAAECLSIAIIGNFHTRREFLAIIRERLRPIHASFKDLTITEHVAIPGYPTLYANYNDLLIHEQLGRRTYIPSGLAQEIPIATILDSVIAPEDRGAIFGMSENLLTVLQQTLVATGFCDDIVSLRGQLSESPVALWVNQLPEKANSQDQAYEIIRHFHGRTTTDGDDGLDLFLEWLISKLPLGPQREKLINLSRQVITERTAYYRSPPAQGPANVTYHISVKEGGQVAAIGNDSRIQGGAHFEHTR